MDILISRVQTIAVSIAAIAWVTATPVTATATESDNHGHSVVGNLDGKGSNKRHQHKLKWGEPGHSSEVTRTVEIIMGDIFFKPVVVEANVGETVRFLVINDGALVHEFNIGTRHMHLEHQIEMAKMIRLGMMTTTTLNHEKMKHGGMKHEGANSVLLEHGQDAELIWKFTQPGKLDFACNVPGHYEAGMVGLISILEE